MGFITNFFNKYCNKLGRTVRIVLRLYSVRVKGGKSLRNGMWKDVRNCIIMQNKNCGMT